MITFLLLLVGVVLLIVGTGRVLAAKRIEERFQFLMGKYNHAEIACRIMDNQLWRGQTAEQLVDMRGEHAVRKKEMKKNMTKVETWKYEQTGKNRFNVKITLENDIVVSWVE